MFKYPKPVTNSSKNKGPIKTLDEILHKTVSPGKFITVSSWQCGFLSDRSNAIVIIHFTSEPKSNFIGPESLVHKFSILKQVSLQPSTKPYTKLRIVSIHRKYKISNTKFRLSFFQNAMYTCPANFGLSSTWSYGIVAVVWTVS